MVRYSGDNYNMELPLFDACLVVELEEAEEFFGEEEEEEEDPSNWKKILLPYVKYSFPPAVTIGESLIENVPQFCFPDAQLIQKGNQEKLKTSETFSFILTEVDGARRYGYCRRFAEDISRYPIAFCILSSYPCFDIYYQILDIVEDRMRKGGSKSNVSVFSFLKAVLAQSVPQPGQSVVIRTFSQSSVGMEDVKLERRKDGGDRLLDYVSFRSFFCGRYPLSPLNFIAVLFSLLFERRVMVQCTSISHLSDCVLALSAALYPFSWQMVMIPILPHDLLSYAMAPMPFLIGVFSQYEKDLDNLAMNEIVKVDLDKNEVFVLPEDAIFLGERGIMKLTKSLERIIDEVARHSHTWFEREVEDALIDFFSNLLAGYKKFLKKPFERKGFLKKQPKKTRKFLIKMMDTLAFDIFITDRLKAVEKGRKIVCRFEDAIDDPEFLEREKNERDQNDKSGIRLIRQRKKTSTLRIPEAFQVPKDEGKEPMESIVKGKKSEDTSTSRSQKFKKKGKSKSTPVLEDSRKIRKNGQVDKRTALFDKAARAYSTEDLKKSRKDDIPDELKHIRKGSVAKQAKQFGKMTL